MSVFYLARMIKGTARFVFALRLLRFYDFFFELNSHFSLSLCFSPISIFLFSFLNKFNFRDPFHVVISNVPTIFTFTYGKFIYNWTRYLFYLTWTLNSYFTAACLLLFSSSFIWRATLKRIYNKSTLSSTPNVWCWSWIKWNVNWICTPSNSKVTSNVVRLHCWTTTEELCIASSEWIKNRMGERWKKSSRPFSSPSPPPSVVHRANFNYAHFLHPYFFLLPLLPLKECEMAPKKNRLVLTLIKSFIMRQVNVGFTTDKGLIV